MDLTCIPQQSTVFPGVDIGILGAAVNHLFDAATVKVYTAYMPLNSYGNVSDGIETKWLGTITKAPKISRNMVQFECSDPLFLMNMKVPSRLMQSNCPWSFCDANCTLSAGNYTTEFAAAAGSTSRVLVPSSALPQPSNYFAQGVVTCVSGANAGLSQTVKASASGQVTLMVPWLLPVDVGDEFTMIKGCDKTPGTCAGTTRIDGSAEPQNWQLRFGGTPFTPAPSTSF